MQWRGMASTCGAVADPCQSGRPQDGQPIRGANNPVNKNPGFKKDESTHSLEAGDSQRTMKLSNYAYSVGDIRLANRHPLSLCLGSANNAEALEFCSWSRSLGGVTLPVWAQPWYALS